MNLVKEIFETEIIPESEISTLAHLEYNETAYARILAEVERRMTVGRFKKYTILIKQFEDEKETEKFKNLDTPTPQAPKPPRPPERPKMTQSERKTAPPSPLGGRKEESTLDSKMSSVLESLSSLEPDKLEKLLKLVSVL